MGCKPVLRYTRNCSWGVHDRFLETGLHHVPSQKTLCANEECKASQWKYHRLGYLFPEREICEGANKYDTDETAQNAVSPFHIKYGFEVIKRDRMIQSGIL